MLENTLIKKIEDFVYAKPRSVQEISEHIKKNWRTTDRYIERIEKEFGTISTRIFRKGTRGALKIIYASATDKISHTIFQEALEKEIFSGKTKKDFSAFDIFQHLDDKKKLVKTYKNDDELVDGRLKEYIGLLEKAQKQVLFFSGNLSFVNYKNKSGNLYKTIEELIKRNVSIKIICRIDYSGLKNIQKILSLNHKYGKELIEIRHRKQPLRATIIDSQILDLKEINNPTGKEEELSEGTTSFYTLTDKDWIEWITKIFWKMFHSSIGSKKRLYQVERLKIL